VLAGPGITDVEGGIQAALVLSTFWLPCATRKLTFHSRRETVRFSSNPLRRFATGSSMFDMNHLPEALVANWHVWLVTVTLVVAAVIDGIQLKVPNWLTFPMI